MSITNMPATVLNSDDIVSWKFKTSVSDSSHAPSPSREWQTCPRSGWHQVLGFTLTKAMARKLSHRFRSLPDDASPSEVYGHFAMMTNAIPWLLSEKFPVPDRRAALVYKDSARMHLAKVIVLADNRGAEDSPRQPPAPAVVEMIADELELEGAEREPRWFKCVD
ncbi:hypothetical protein BD626DRAFT_420956 [Schizophyllum amplum]|uniref:Uncharacterized protein n=1 Tax=Schizophyllum amplum TaxID=97359 RepID=A0A550CW56_9AGAR|nr:hypothetical protein BD626DRAFT_420956 [Auriculariopsis ampla]